MNSFLTRLEAEGEADKRAPSTPPPDLLRAVQGAAPPLEVGTGSRFPSDIGVKLPGAETTQASRPWSQLRHARDDDPGRWPAARACRPRLPPRLRFPHQTKGVIVASLLKSHTRHKTFISYHHADEAEVAAFIDHFDHDHDVLISRGIGASMAGDVIDSTNADYIKQRIRQLYLRDSSVTLVMVGAETWGRRFVDWEVAASLRNTATSSRNGLLAITLPSIANSTRTLPARVDDNVDGTNGYARWMKYPTSTLDLGQMIDAAYTRRTTHASVVDNSRALRQRNAS